MEAKAQCGGGNGRGRFGKKLGRRGVEAGCPGAFPRLRRYFLTCLSLGRPPGLAVSGEPPLPLTERVLLPLRGGELASFLGLATPSKSPEEWGSIPGV